MSVVVEETPNVANENETVTGDPTSASSDEITVNTVEPESTIAVVTKEEEEDDLHCLNCGRDACMAEENECDNAFCGEDCQRVYRNPSVACQAIDVGQMIRNMETNRVKVTSHFILCVITETEGNCQRDSLLSHIIRVESGNVVAQVFGRNGELSAKYYLTQRATNVLIIPRGVQYSLVVAEKGQIARVSITRTS